MATIKTVTIRTTFGTRERLIFPNDNKVKEFELSHKGESIYIGTVDECYMRLQDSQSQSADWAMKNDGWKIEPTGNLMDDPDIEVEVVKLFLNVLTFKYLGETYEVRKDVVYGSIPEPGKKVRINSFYARFPSSK